MRSLSLSAAFSKVSGIHPGHLAIFDIRRERVRERRLFSRGVPLINGAQRHEKSQRMTRRYRRSCFFCLKRAGESLQRSGRDTEPGRGELFFCGRRIVYSILLSMPALFKDVRERETEGIDATFSRGGYTANRRLSLRNE